MNNEPLHPLDPLAWAEQHFGAAHLGDRRRVQRAVTLAAGMARQPGGSIPQLFLHRYDVKAAYTLLDRPEVTPQHLQAGHTSLVKARLQMPGTYLLLEDSTELGWTRVHPVADLASIGNLQSDQCRGFLLHTTLAVRRLPDADDEPNVGRPAVEVLGIADQEYLLKKPRPPGEKVGDVRSSQKRADRLSMVWLRSGERMGDVPEEAGVRWVRVADREADLYEYLCDCRARGHGFVVRAAYDRVLLDTQSDRRNGQYLLSFARTLAATGEFTLPLRARTGVAARQARLSLSAAPVRILAPDRPGHTTDKSRLPAYGCTVVRVWEADPPVGVKEPLEWFLLTDVPVTDAAQARECARQYATRWLIEEYHKALKTGLGADKLQLETGARLKAAVALMSVVAVRLLALKEQARVDPQAPAEKSGLDAEELQVLAAATERRLTTTGEVALAIGRLGGHMNRRSDGLPGWQTLWRGMTRLTTLVEGYRLGRNRFGE